MDVRCLRMCHYGPIVAGVDKAAPTWLFIVVAGPYV